MCSKFLNTELIKDSIEEIEEYIKTILPVIKIILMGYLENIPDISIKRK